MLLSSLLLLLLAAALHALANVLMKGATDKLAFSWWMIGVFCVAGLPSLFFLPDAPRQGWILVVSSGLLEAVYFVTLAKAYQNGDLSVVYPIARGSAPLFLLCWASIFLGERPSLAGLLGIASIVAGLYIINLPSLADWNRPLLGFKSSGARWALVTGILISTYTAIDKAGVQYFPPVVYLFLILSVSWLGMSLQLLHPARRAAVLQELKRSDGRGAGWKGILAGAIFGTGAYALVLAAMKLSPVSYVAPVREVSVVIGAWVGVRYLGEKGGPLRIGGAILVSAGILMIAIGG